MRTPRSNPSSARPSASKESQLLARVRGHIKDIPDPKAQRMVREIQSLLDRQHRGE